MNPLQESPIPGLYKPMPEIIEALEGMSKPHEKCTQFIFQTQAGMVAGREMLLNGFCKSTFCHAIAVQDVVEQFEEVVKADTPPTQHPDGSTTIPASCIVRTITTTNRRFCLIVVTTSNGQRRRIEKIRKGDVKWHPCTEVADMLRQGLVPKSEQNDTEST